jgi:hypothetical protein
MLPVVLIARSRRKRLVIAADREALRATGDARAAEQALTTLLRAWETDDPQPGKHWTWRFEALRDSAFALGLSPPGA